jgi:hypothetical protein
MSCKKATRNLAIRLHDIVYSYINIKLHSLLYLCETYLLYYCMYVRGSEFDAQLTFHGHFQKRCECKKQCGVYLNRFHVHGEAIIIASWGRSAACKTNKRRQSTDGRAGRSNLCRVRRTSGDTLFRSHELTFRRSRLPHRDNYSQRRLHFNFRKKVPLNAVV